FHTGRGATGASNLLAEELEKEEQHIQWGSGKLEGKQPPEIKLD
ncbi:hypothetical protein, partial [Halobacillus trueperi]